MQLRRSTGRVQPESEQIDAITSSLEKLYTNKCTGKGNELDLKLEHYGIHNDSTVGKTKKARCAHLAAYLVRNNIESSNL